jgi:GT2 family glycosyltransferase
VKIVVADNRSTDGSREWLQETYPDVYCLCLDDNLGPAGARNAVLYAADARYILFLDNDITVEPDTLDRLLQVMGKLPKAAVCHPEICDPNDETAYHYNGGAIHYLRALISRDKPTNQRPEYELFNVVSGAALLVDRTAALDVGGFDEDYFFNWEDGDFLQRLTLAGYLCVNVPSAPVLHRGKARGVSKAYYMVRNRWFFILKLYEWKTLILILPALLVFEAAQAVLLLAKGGFADYCKANRDVLRSLPETFEKRYSFRKMKQKRDRDWLQSGDMYVPQSVVKSTSLIGILNTVLFRAFDGYWAIVSPFC